MALILYGSLGIIAARYSEESEKKFDIKTEILVLARNPIFIALGLGIILHFALPHIKGINSNQPFSLTMQCLTLIGSATIPVIMTAIGIRLNAGHARKYLPMICAFGAIKMILMPIAALFVGRYLYHLDLETLKVCVLICAMPPAAAAAAFSADLKVRPELCVANFFVLTLVSAITIPLIMGLVR
jgi:predicted permease